MFFHRKDRSCIRKEELKKNEEAILKFVNSLRTLFHQTRCTRLAALAPVIYYRKLRKNQLRAKLEIMKKLMLREYK